MMPWDPKVNDLFLDALDQKSRAAQQAFLDAACAGDADLRARVESLLVADEKAGNFLEHPADDLALTRAWTCGVGERPGTQIGPYQLIQEIGEGGMGVVYVAVQHEPVRRKVALKIIKPGMDSREVVARFKAEEQALALMDHPHIAHVYDAGTTDSGRPYFVMELVNGVTLTQYCDDNNATTRQRLELFVLVCHAVQHAHQKGIIHRDIKPSNILVTLHDGVPVPKIIDFGIAKAISGGLTSETMATGGWLGSNAVSPQRCAAEDSKGVVPLCAETHHAESERRSLCDRAPTHRHSGHAVGRGDTVGSARY